MKVGDRVIALDEWDEKDIKGLVGTVIDCGSDYCSVEFDEFMGGHNGNYFSGKDGHCWNMPLSLVEVIEKEEDKPVKVRWYSKGKQSVKSGEFEVGDIVYCLQNRNDGGWRMTLTIGKGYEIQHINNTMNTIDIFNDANIDGRYSMKFFTLTPMGIDYLKKQEEMKQKMKDVDPYGEEEWD